MKNFFHTGELPLYMSVEDLRDVLRISRTRAYEIIHAEGFPAVWLGRRCVIPREKFLSWMDAQASAAGNN